MRLAVALEAHIVGVDSMQVYRGMDIGTAKPTVVDRNSVPHHMIDIADPAEDYTVARFQADGRRVLTELAAASVTAVIAGGSGLHFRALVDPLRFPPTDEALRTELESTEPDALLAELRTADPGAGDHVDLANPRRVLRAVEVLRLTGETPTARAGDEAAVAVAEYRPDVDFVGIGIDPGEPLRSRIAARFDAMLEAGLLDEVAALEPHLGRMARQAVGYKELLPVVAGTSSLAEAREAAIGATAALAKRQRTYFRRDPRIVWLQDSEDDAYRFEKACEIIVRATGDGHP